MSYRVILIVEDDDGVIGEAEILETDEQGEAFDRWHELADLIQGGDK